MHPKFAAFAERLHPSFERLMACEPITGARRLPLTAPSCGVYLFSEGDDHLYVGRTNRLRARHREHWASTSKQNDAPFAFKLARYATDNVKAKGGPTRLQLQANATFSEAFLAAKSRITAMQFRWVEEEDPHTQYLLEMYASVALDARYNDFENH
jgi:hypothetical protein